MHYRSNRASDLTIKPRIFTQDTIERLSMSKNRKVLNVSNLEYVPRWESIVHTSLDFCKTNAGKRGKYSRKAGENVS